jgi:ribose transport system substrate-binding protein
MKMKFVCVTLLLSSIALSAAEPLKIAVIPKSKDNVYWQAVRAGAVKAAADLKGEGTEVTILWDGTDREDQTDAQKALVAGFVTQKVNGIVLAPLNPQALVSSVEQADAAKIPVIVIDSPLASPVPKATVATNNYKAGALAARRLAEAVGAKGNVALFRYMKGHSSTLPRESGFLDGLKKYPGIHVVSSDIYAGATVAEQSAHAKELLEKAGDLQGVFGSNLYATLGMLSALRDSGKAGKIAFVGFDASDPIIDAVRKGDMAGVAVQQPFMMGYLGVKTVVQAIQGKPVDHEVDTDVKMVTKENLDTPDVQALLNPGAK